MKTNKTTYALLAFGPLAVIIFAILLMFGVMIGSGMFEPYARPSEEAVFGILGASGIVILGAIFSFVSMILFIMHISKNKHIPEDQRIFWILGMVFANGITNIVYYFVYITKEDELEEKYRMQAPTQNPWG
jgi:hypothetical protein